MEIPFTGLKSRCCQASFLLEALRGESVSLHFLDSGIHPYSLAPDHFLHYIASCSYRHVSSVSFFSCVLFFFFFNTHFSGTIGTPVIISGPPDSLSQDPWLDPTCKGSFAIRGDMFTSFPVVGHGSLGGLSTQESCGGVSAVNWEGKAHVGWR